MEKSRKVYLVTSGEYSDYGIRAIFSTRDKANIYKTQINQQSYTDADIEEWVLDEAYGEVLVELNSACIRLQDGSWEPRWPIQRMATPNQPAVIEKGLCWFNGVKFDCITVRVQGSKELAEKIAIEARQKWLREQSVTTAQQ